jgi:hypothetical protein
MSDQNDRPLAHWTTSHIIGFLGLAGAGTGAWLALNDRVTRVEADATTSITYRAENTRRLERMENNQTKLMIALGVKPEIE